MQEDVLLRISNRLRELRKEKNITLQELADQAGVSKGLLSQIENSRTIPSLLVLLNLIKELKIDLNEFFKDINLNPSDNKLILRQQADYQPFEKENAQGFHYRRILSTTLQDVHLDFVLLTLKPGATREPVQTEAFEFKFLLSGTVRYCIGNQELTLHQGDSLFFDGTELHNPYNETNQDAVMLVIYFFGTKNEKRE